MFSPVASEYSVMLHDKLVKAERNRNSVAFALTSDEFEKRRAFVVAFKAFDEAVLAGVPGSFRVLFDELYPVWVDEVNHEVVHDFRVWFPADINRNFAVSNDTVNRVNEFFADAWGEDSEVVDARIDRIDSGLVKIQSVWAGVLLYKSFYDSTFDVNWLNWFIPRERFYLPQVISAFNKGFVPDVVKVVSAAVLVKFTPEVVNEFLTVYDARVLKQLVSLDTHGRQALTAELLWDLAEVGFSKAVEVRDYARRFGVGFTDNDFYDRVIAAKSLYPVLADYVSVV